MKNEIKRLFNDKQITFDGKNWKINNSKVDINVITAVISGSLPDGLNPYQAIEIFQTKTDGKKLPSISGTLKTIQINHGSFQDNNWSSVDEDFFNKIFYTTNEIDNTVMMLIKSDENVFQPIIRGSNKQENYLNITSTCCNVMVGNVNYHDWLTTKWKSLVTLTNTTLMAIYSDHKLTQDQKLEDAVEWLCANIPNSILYRYNSIVALCKTIVTESDTYNSPVSFHFQNESGEPFEIINHIQNIYDIIVQKKYKEVEMPVAYSSVKGVNCFNYFDLNAYKTIGPTPNWDMFLKRFTQDEASVFKSFVWSIFDSTNTSRQALYLYDNGFSGKSKVINAISNVLGNNLHTGVQKGSLNNQFGVAKIWDKRLVTKDDNKDPNVFRTEIFHVATGGGKAEVEMKGKNSFSAKLDLKFIVCGNILPEIDTTATHEFSRVILLKLKMTDEIYKQIAETDENGNLVLNRQGKPKLLGDPNFEKNLTNEFPAFLSKCEEDYRRLCPTGMQIMLPDSVEDEILNLDSQEIIQYNEFIKDNLTYDVNGYVRRIDLQRMYNIHAEKYNLGTHANDYKDFVGHLTKMPNVTFTRIRIDGDRVNVVKGVKLKSFVPPQLTGIINDIEESDSTINFDD